MTRITNTDQIIILLRDQLQRMDRTQKKQLTPKTDKAEAKSQSPLERVKSLTQIDDLAEQDIHRALIGGILTEEFGPAVANDPEFQTVIDNVVTLIRKDGQGKTLLDEAINQLSKSS